MHARLGLLVAVCASGCVLDFEQLVLKDAGPSTVDAGQLTDAGADAGFDAGQLIDAGTDAGSWLNVGDACTRSSQCLTGKCAGQCVPWASSVANVPMGATLVGPDDRPWWVGWYNSRVDFGSGTLQPNPLGAANAITSRRSSDGTEDTSFVLEPSFTTVDSVAFTVDGGLVVAGENYGTSLMMFPVGTPTTHGDVYVARLATAGGVDVTWVTNVGGFYAERRPRIAAAPSGDVFVTGWTSSASLNLVTCSATACDGGTVGTRDAGTDWFTFVARLDGRSGTPLWVDVVRSPAHVDSRAIAYSAVDDTVVVGGAFIDTLLVDGATDGGFSGLSRVNDDDAWLLKLSGATGSFIWGRVFGQGSNDSVQSLAVDPAGNIYVGALYANLGAVAPLPAVPVLSPIVLKLSASNQVQWGRVLLASSPVTPPRAGQFASQNGYTQIGVLVAPDGGLVVSGWTNQTLSTGPMTIVTPSGVDENFLFPLSEANGFQASRVLTFRATAGAIATPVLAPNGNLFVSGTFAGTLTLPLDGGTLTKTSDAGLRDFFSASLGRWP